MAPGRRSHPFPTGRRLLLAGGLLASLPLALALAGPTGPGDRMSAGGDIDDAVRDITDFPLAPPPLSELPLPLPENLGLFVTDFDAAVKLGKVLFWDVQIGSDGLTACATCHYHAGANNRFKNTLAPGANGAFDFLNGTGRGANLTLNTGSFPFHRFLDPDEGETVVQSVDDVRGAQGVHKKSFGGIVPGSAVDLGSSVADPTFNVNGVNVRQNTGRDAPNVYGAIFLFRLFWDGRASQVFNGKTIWGEQDPDARVLVWTPGGGTRPIQVQLRDGAAASQAVGPPLSDVEMSWAGRTWEDIGVKMLSLPPLASQRVDPTDSVLGSCANPNGDGLLPGVTYASLIQDAFHQRWWGSPDLFHGFTQMEYNFSLYFGLAILAYESTLVPDQTPYDHFAAGNAKALTEQQKDGLDIFINRGDCLDCHNGSLFAGHVTPDMFAPPPPGEMPEPEGLLERMGMENSGAEAELEFADNPIEPGVMPLHFDPREKVYSIFPPGYGDHSYPHGIDPIATGYLWAPPGACPPEDDLRVDLTVDASIDPLLEVEAEVRLRLDGNCGMQLGIGMGWAPPGLPAGDYPVYAHFKKIGVLRMPDVNPNAVYDNGFYNIGVRPTAEDLGVGADGPFGPLSLTKRYQNGEDIPIDPGIDPPPQFGERVAVRGAFKTPTMRNIWLTAPYMHNGGHMTLDQVVDFYSRGADFREANIDDLDPAVSGIGGMDDERKAALVSFLKALTDPRVLHESAPYDHPELPLPHGSVGNHRQVVDDGTGNAVDEIELIAGTGAAGGPPLIEFGDRLAAFVTVYPESVTVVEDSVPPLVEPDGLEPNQFTVRLHKRPRYPVTIYLTSSDPSQAIAEPSTLVFKPEDARKPQTVTVEAVSDGLPEGLHVIDIITSAAISTDPDYAGLPIADVEVTIIDSGDTLLLLGIEAEDGILEAPMEVGLHPAASGGEFVWAPQGTGDSLPPSPFSSPGIAEYDFVVSPNQAAAGPVQIWARECAPNGRADTFWFQVNDDIWMQWILFREPTGAPAWDLLNNNGGAYSTTLEAGLNTLRIAHAEDGAMLDRLVFTNDPAFVPTGAPVDPSDP